MGVSTGRAYQLVDEALQQAIQEPVDDLRRLEFARLEELMKTWFPKARDGRWSAISIVLRIIRLEIKLLGLEREPHA